MTIHTTEAIELKPCPFCGGEAEIWPANDNRKAWVACISGCCVVSKEYDNNVDAITAWNTRPTPLLSGSADDMLKDIPCTCGSNMVPELHYGRYFWQCKECRAEPPQANSREAAYSLLSSGSAAEALEEVREALEICIGDILYMAKERNQLDRFQETVNQASEAVALIPTLSAALAKEPVSVERISLKVHGRLYESSREYVKAVLDAAGVPYTEAALAGGEKGE